MCWLVFFFYALYIAVELKSDRTNLFLSLKIEKEKKKERKKQACDGYYYFFSFSWCVLFSSVPWPIGSSAGTWGTIQQRSSSSLFCRRPLWAVLAWAGIRTFDVVYPAFPLPTTASSTVQGAPKDGFGEAVVLYDIPEPCNLSTR